jgi:hypothetical protein
MKQVYLMRDLEMVWGVGKKAYGDGRQESDDRQNYRTAKLCRHVIHDKHPRSARAERFGRQFRPRDFVVPIG